MSSELHGDKEHEKFREMCALAASRSLTATESAELESHLEKCDSCREILSQYRALGTQGMAALAAKYSEDHNSQSWDKLASWEKLLARLRDDQAHLSADKPPECASVSNSGWLRWVRAKWFKRIKLRNPSASSK